MEFNPHHGVDIQKKIRKFWGSLTSMITGGEHEYVYLRGIIDKIKYVKETKCKKAKKGAHRTPFANMGLATRINQHVAAGGSLAKAQGQHNKSNSAPPGRSPLKKAASVLYHP